MQRLLPLALALAAVPGLYAQANVVAGLDGRLSDVNDLTYWGRRGAAHPNGEVGMSMLNTMCNPGSVNIPWYAAMQGNHPTFGFMIVRESGGRMVQINDWSYVKHAFTSTNFSGACGSCVNPGTGSLMGLNCSDTYGAGNNGDRYWLGPPEEIDPWLGTWQPVGSYFDRGDPQVTGAALTDGARSLSNAMVSAMDAVKNRVTVREADLLVQGARYFYGIHLIHQGEASANRWDNLASRGFNPSWGGSGWTFSNNSVGQIHGTILQHWQGATVNGGKNGNDDGTFYVAVNVTALGNGQYHYEYAVHNFDNSRGGAQLRIPCASNAVVTNFGSRDPDTNALNDWTGARVGNEIVFSAGANNPLNWNNLYNFWFDCNIPPGQGGVLVDQARPGAGSLTVAVTARVPGGTSVASVASVGSACGQCTPGVYEQFGAGAFDLNNSRMSMMPTSGGYAVSSGTATFVPPVGTALALTDDSEATVTLPFAFPFPGGTTTTLHVCSNGFVSVGSNGTSYTPSGGGFMGFANRSWSAGWHDYNPVATGTTGRVLVDSNASRVLITWNAVPSYGNAASTSTFQYQFLPSGQVDIVWQTMGTGGNGFLVGYKPAGTMIDPGGSDLSAVVPAGFTLCPQTVAPLTLATGDRPVLGTTMTLTTTNVPAGSPFGSMVLSLQQAVPPQDLTALGMPGCFNHTVGGNTYLFLAPSSSYGMQLTVPNTASLVGVSVVAQASTWSPPLTPLGAITSNALVMLVGQL